MSNSKMVYYLFVFFCFACSTVSSYLNTSTLIVDKLKCSPQQSSELLLFKHNLSSNISTDDPLYYSACRDWLGSGYYPIMMNWNASIDCCDWNGVTCDYSTGDVIGLDLSCGLLQGNIHPNTSLFNLPHLQKLNLAFNDFSDSQIPHEIGRFSNSLTHLNFSETGFGGLVPAEITLLHKLVSLDISIYLNNLSMEPRVFIDMLRNSTSLEELTLSDVNISSTLPNYLNISSSLKLLSLRGTGLQGKLPDHIFNLRFMEVLDLSYNSFTGEIPREISLLPKLVSLDLSGNDNLRIQPHIFNDLLNNSTLLRDLSLPAVNISWVLPTDRINISSSITYLELQNCSLMGSLPKYPLNLTHIIHLDLGNNKLNGTLPSWLFTLPSLKRLYLDYNKFTGVPSDSFARSPIEYLSLGNNELGGQIDQAFILKLTNLVSLVLSFNNFSSDWELDMLLSSLTNLNYLDLSYSGVSITDNNATHHANPNFYTLKLASCKLKEFPVSLQYMENLITLDLSSNEISGVFPLWTRGNNLLAFLNLSHNFITGLPQFEFYALVGLYLQSNQIQGPFPPSICNMSDLYQLDLSNNNFSGVIPPCFGNFSSSLQVVVLSNNDFIGTIPNTYEDCGMLEGLILKGNQLQGELPTSLSSCHHLRVLDLGDNHLNDTFPNWLGGLSQLQVLNLNSNNFHGRIVTSYAVKFPFPSLRVLDLSQNTFVGQLPTKYFQHFNAMKNVAKIGTKLEYMNTNGLYYSINVSVKGKDQYFQKLTVEYTIISLSNNNFEGNIPDIIGSLNSLIVLDLSHNSLTGRIPKDLGKLSEIESLDLSWNQLNGEIPQSLADLTFLAFLNVSQNHLVGRIPTGKQFNTFGSNSFGGNPNLCGLPLPQKCNENPQPPQLGGDEDEEENGFTLKAVMLGYGCGIPIGLVMGYLMLLTGRPKWFNVIADEVERMILNKGEKRR
ncbi:receptor-like protein 6 [Rutidosis leptorrhynchoides]|uniref:receptor-like protein 6 n=1 Tax=Rutidosis leptorrhynchoides TaxID=125765 RepID=UPI003A99CE77